MAKRLAVTFSGAVSLGSYEAGVLYEVLYAIGRHNLQPDMPEDQKIYIDVLTGASAGGLSVALAAQKLLYDGDSLSDPYDNPLYHAWVTDIDLTGLLNCQSDEPADCALFSSNLIQKLSSEYILSRYDGAVPAPVKTHPAVGPEGTVQLGLALSNLNGVDYSRPTLGSGEFTYTRFQDEFIAALGPDTDTKAVWTPIQQAAVSCGAFPVAFRAVDLIRNISCFDAPYLDRTPWTSQTRSFTYTDGGIFQNEPLGLAKNLVDLIDQHQHSSERGYLFVAPDPKASTADGQFTADTANFKNLGGRLVNAIFNQARFHDWIEAEEVNDQIDLFNTRAEQLCKLFQNGTISASAVQAVSQPLLAQFFNSSQASDLAAAREQLIQQFLPEYRQLSGPGGPGQEAADAWIDAILIFELAADLHEKDEMYIYAVTATDKELAGSQLMAFLGFFDQTYRQHDYDVGRTKAQNFLANPSAQKPGPLSTIQYSPQPIRAVDPELANLQISKVSRQKREQLSQSLCNRADILLQELGLSAVLRKTVEEFFVNKKIDAFLGL